MCEYFDQNRNRIRLGEEIGKGGEGAVFEVQSNPSLAAKIYFKALHREKAQKISSMIGCGNDRLLKLSSWPLQSVHNRSGEIVGFLMQKLSGYKPLYQLYSPKLRLQQFPQADWRFLIHTAANTARVFGVIHEAGHVIGDVNHGNLMVAKDSTVKLIDTDSFQVMVNQQHWLCEVGVATHQPPEMQGLSSYKSIIRTPNHDNFGLAVLIFQLLCLARHPFSGRFSGRGEMPLEKAITEFRFAYSKDKIRTQMIPPPACLSMDALSPILRALFERAFSVTGKEKGRPLAKEWTQALEAFIPSIKACSSNAGHYYFNGATLCPWCQIEAQSNTLLFPHINATSKIQSCFESLWKQVSSLQTPNFIAKLPDIRHIQVSPTQSALDAKNKFDEFKQNRLVIVSIGLGLITAFSMMISPNLFYTTILFSSTGLYAYYKRVKNKICKKIKKKLKDSCNTWKTISDKLVHSTDNQSFLNVRDQIDILKKKYDALNKEKQEAIRQLWKNRRQQQLIQHLDQFRIENAKIKGIGPGKSSVLQSYGIETAADLHPHKLFVIKGFGEKLIQRMIDWRLRCENSFIFSPAKEISPTELQAIENKFGKKKVQIETELAQGLLKLRGIKKQLEAHFQYLQTQVNAQALVYAQALADARLVKLRK
ncbi:MAG: hypothetical protein KDK55_04280 [Chlamydiia bacterium]|nr:hypothetical protein [Chlamydiia bacterium]